jgi:hypothetical protein
MYVCIYLILYGVWGGGKRETHTGIQRKRHRERETERERERERVCVCVREREPHLCYAGIQVLKRGVLQYELTSVNLHY